MANPTETNLVPGQMVGDYRVEQKIGEGAFGIVYSAVHPVIGKKGAIKVLNPQFASNPDVVRRFVDEARAVNQIRHRHIIDVFAFGQLETGLHYFVMELLEGKPFDEYLLEKGALPPAHAFAILKRVARALEAAHKVGIAHRDLKPENVYLTFDEDGEVFPKLLDFGIAKLLGETSAEHATQAGMPMGTPLYMSPEQCKGGTIDQRTDVYAFGVMMHEALAGRRPLEGDNAMEVMMMQISQQPPPLSAHRPGTPAAVDAAILQMMAKDPAQRPHSIRGAFETVVAAAEQSGMLTGALPGGGQPSSPGGGQPSLPGGGQPSLASGGQAPPPVAQAVSVTAPTLAQGPGAAPLALGTAQVGTAAAVTAMGSTMASPAPEKKRTGLFIGMGAVAVAGIIGIAVAVGVGGGDSKPASGEPSASATAARKPASPGFSVAAAAPPVGVVYHDEQLLSANINITDLGKSVGKLHNREHRRSEITVTEVDGEHAAKITAKYLEDEETEDDGTPPIQKTKEPTVGRTFLLQDNGEEVGVSLSPAGAALKVQQEAVADDHWNLFEDRLPLFNQPLAKGAAVKIDGKRLLELIGLEQDDVDEESAASIKVVFTGHKLEQERPIASFDVSFSYAALGEDEGVELSMAAPLSGELKFDAASGWLTSARLDGRINGSMEAGGKSLELGGTLRVSRTLHR